MIFKIPGNETIEIENVVLDYNGTIAVDGQLIEGVATLINEISGEINVYVLTADTYGTVTKKLASVNCKLVIIPENHQDISKRDFVLQLGKEKTLCVGNGRNDRLMMKECILSVAVIQEEGVCVESLMAADIACQSILDVFAYFQSPNRLKATLRN